MNMSQKYPKYEFISHTRKRYETASNCPICHKSNRDGKFAPIIINKSPQPEYGYCHSCSGVSFPGNKIRGFSPQNSNQESSINYVPNEKVLNTIYPLNDNPFHQFLFKQFSSRAKNIVKKYRIGITKDGATIFWYRDINGHFRNGKVVFYTANGKRDKNKLIYYLYKTSDGYPLCLFNEYYLKDYPFHKPVYLVESEKTALYMQEVFPEKTFLATGGANGLTKAKARVLKGRNVVFINDCDDAGRRAAKNAKTLFSKLGIKIEVLDLDPNLNNGKDALDFFVNN
jgi:hypothetical protein